MSVETTSFFAQAIQHHLELKQQNATLEPQHAAGRLQVGRSVREPPALQDRGTGPARGDAGRNEPAVVAHVHTLTWPGEEKATDENGGTAHAELEDSLWGRESRDFDWGD